LAHDYPAFWTGKRASQWLRKPGVFRTMSSQMRKKIVVRAVNLCNELAWAQENFEAGS